MKLKVVSMSGAATKIVAHIAHCQNLKDNGYKPDIFAGVSSGILTSIAWAFNKLDEAEELAKNLNYSDIFGIVPVNKKGKVTTIAYLRGLTMGSFGTCKGLEKTIRKFIPEDRWVAFRRQKEKELYCGVYNVTKRRFELINMKKFTYELFLKYTVASSAIPIYCEPIRIGDDYFWDGGLQEHNPSKHVIEKHKDNISELVSIYSRPEDKSQEPDWAYNGKSLGRNLSVVIDAMQDAISYSNQEDEIVVCDIEKIQLTQLFAPRIMKGVYDIDKTRLSQLYHSIRVPS